MCFDTSAGSSSTSSGVSMPGCSQAIFSATTRAANSLKMLLLDSSQRIAKFCMVGARSAGGGGGGRGSWTECRESSRNMVSRIKAYE
jgi:hypothetical protein